MNPSGTPHLAIPGKVPRPHRSMRTGGGFAVAHPPFTGRGPKGIVSRPYRRRRFHWPARTGGGLFSWTLPGEIPLLNVISLRPSTGTTFIWVPMAGEFAMGMKYGFSTRLCGRDCRVARQRDAAIELITSMVSCTFAGCIMPDAGSLSTSTTTLLWISTSFLLVGPLCAVSLLSNVGGVGGGVLADSRHTSSLGCFGRSNGSTSNID